VTVVLRCVTEGLEDWEAVRDSGFGRGLLLMLFVLVVLFCRGSDCVGRLGLGAAGLWGAVVAGTAGGLRWAVALGAELVLLTVAVV
jgi:hypothetical protein